MDDGKQANNEQTWQKNPPLTQTKALSKLKCTCVRNKIFLSFELLISEDT